MKPVTADTRATAIRIGNPASWRKSAAVIEQMGGWCEQVQRGGDRPRQGRDRR